MVAIPGDNFVKSHPTATAVGGGVGLVASVALAIFGAMALYAVMNGGSGFAAKVGSALGKAGGAAAAGVGGALTLVAIAVLARRASLLKGDEPAAPKAETPKPETPKAETPKAETPKAETPKAETPKPETPKPETPKAETPKSETPKPAAPTEVARQEVGTPTPVGNGMDHVLDAETTVDAPTVDAPPVEPDVSNAADPGNNGDTTATTAGETVTDGNGEQDAA